MNSTLANAITTFLGEANGQSITFFIKNLADLTLIEGWTDQMKVWMLRNKLVGKATNYVNSIPLLTNENDFDTLCNKLIEHFTTSQFPQELQAEFSNLAHHPKESVQQLAVRITSVVKRFVPNPRNSPDLENVRETEAPEIYRDTKSRYKGRTLKIWSRQFFRCGKQSKKYRISFKRSSTYCKQC